MTDVLAALSASGAVGDVLQGCAEAVVRRLDAAFARIWVLNEADRMLELRASAGLYTHLDGGHSRVPVGELKIGRIARDARPHLTNDVVNDPQVSDPVWAQREGMVAFAGYPLLAGRRVVGVVGLFARHVLAAESLSILAEVAAAIAAAIERIRMQERLRAEHAVLVALHRVGVALTSAQFDLRQMVQTVTDAATELSGAGFGAFFYTAVADSGESSVLYTVSGASRDDFAGFGLPLDSPLFAPTLRGPGIVRLDDVTTDPRYGQVSPHHGIPSGHLSVRSYLAVPVMGRDGVVLGGLFFGHSEPGVFTDEAELAVSAIANHAAMAIENARFYQREHDVALTLQRSLLPDHLPELSTVALAARYLPAAQQAEVGGDWYDALVLPDGRLGLSVGDVVGHDIHAAATMGQLRSALRACMLQRFEAPEVVECLEQFMTATGLKEFTTLAYAVFDSQNRSLQVVRAGHPPPLLLGADGSARYLHGGATPPLGLGLIELDALNTASITVTLEPGTTVLFFTDGLIERRRWSFDEGMTALIAAVGTVEPGDPEALCEAVLAALHGHGHDDTVLLAMTVR
ncbi:MAG: SpoIIE family protein phosphatase [Actinomycetota bacterium]|nr:SpoIIE family protein phosphatase [Actinomycetota bacterium]